jgi:hypothetical protein
MKIRPTTPPTRKPAVALRFGELELGLGLGLGLGLELGGDGGAELAEKYGVILAEVALLVIWRTLVDSAPPEIDIRTRSRRSKVTHREPLARPQVRIHRLSMLTLRRRT